jgi:predicted GNAT family N-acyltransferase
MKSGKMTEIKVLRFNFDDEAKMQDAIRIRTEVFVHEQGVPAALEYDGEDRNASHYLLKHGEESIATARWRFTSKGIKLERFAMLSSWRNSGTGRYLLDAVLGDVLPLGRMVYLHSQARAVNFYLRRGFEIEGDAFEEAGITHYLMVWPQPMG